MIDWVGPLLLERAEIDRIPSRIPGVYLLHSLAQGFGGYATFYAGQSTDLRRRLREHLGDRTAKDSIRLARAFGPAHFSAAPVLDEALRSAVGAGLIEILRPICNGQQPGADPIIVPLPPFMFFN